MKIKQILKNENEDLHTKIGNILDECGVRANLHGYAYLREAIYDESRKPLTQKKVTEMYAFTAYSFNTTPSRVERAMRHALEMAWKEQHINKSQILEENFKFSKRSNIRPTVSEFIYTVVDKIQTYTNV